MNFVTIFTNLSAEYPEFLSAILMTFAVLGIYIAGTGILSIAKLGRRDTGLVTPGSYIMWRIIGGSSLTDLSIWAKAWSGSLWADSNILDISSYQGAGTNFDAPIMAAIGMMVITGWVTLGRAYLMVTKIGGTPIESRGELGGAIFARIIAGTALISTVHVAMAIQASTGMGFFS